MLFDKRLLRLGWDQRRYFVIATISGIAGGVLAIWQACLFSRVVSEVFLRGKGLNYVWGILLTLLGVLALRSLLSGSHDLFSSIGCYYLKLRTRDRLVDLVTKFWKLGEEGKGTGEIPSVFLDRVDSLDSYFGQYIPQVLQAGILPPILLLTVFFIDPLSGVVFLLTGPLIPFFMRLIGQAAKQQTEKQWQRLSQLSSFLFESLQGLPMLKRLGISQLFTYYLDENGRAYRDVTLEVLRISFLSALVLELLTTLSTAIVAVQVGLRLLYGWMSLEQALFVLLIAPEYYLPLRLLGQKFHAGITGMTGGQRVLNFLNQAEETISNPHEEDIHFDQSSLMSILTDPQNEIRFMNVGFQHPHHSLNLTGIHFSMRTGQITALVGESGSGKTTIAHLLLRLLSPSEGEIMVGDQPIRQIPINLWWESIGWVAQQPYLFHGTIRENISLGMPSATVEQVEVAARMANAWEFIRSLPQGLETVIGEAGIGLSSGQAQRLALARAYLKNAPILIWDEGGANIDVVSLELILESLRQFSKGRKVLLISHQPQVIEIADQIVNVQDFQVHNSMNNQPISLSSFVNQTKIPSLEVENGDIQGFELRLSTSTQPVETHDEIPTWFEVGSTRDGYKRSLSYSIAKLISMLFPLMKWIGLAVILNVGAIWSNIGLMFASAYIISFAALQPSIAVLQVAIVGVRFFGISRGVWRYFERLTSHRITLDLLTRLRVRLYQHLEERTPNFFIKFSSGEVLSRLLGDVAALEPFYVRSVSPYLSAFVVSVAMVISIGLFVPKLRWVLSGFYIFSGVVLPVLYYYLTKRFIHAQNHLRGSAVSSLVKMIQGIEELLVYRTLPLAQADLKHWLEKYTRSVLKSGMLLSSQSFITNLVAYLALWVCMVVVIPSVNGGDLNGVYLASIVLAVYVSFEALLGLSNAAQVMVTGALSAERLFNLIEEVEVQADTHGSKHLHQIEKVDISIQNITFSYNSASLFEKDGRPIIQDFSLEIPSGKRIAIVGPSGAGKSTLVSIMLGLYPVQKGDIFINGESLSLFDLAKWRNSVASCAQDDFLFHTTLEKNLTILATNTRPDQLNEVVQEIGLEPLIQRLPNGLETVVGEHGGYLSGGEQKRCLITRTLLRESNIYIFDEPFAELDEFTAKRVFQAIKNKTRGKTLIVISHLPWGLESFDEIIVLEAGRISQRGTHHKLIAEDGYYSRLYLANTRQTKNNHKP